MRKFLVAFPLVLYCLILTAVGVSILLPSTACADELVIHTFSRHTERNSDERKEKVTQGADGSTVTSTWIEKKYNNADFGVGYRWDSGTEVGAYYNSDRKLTTYVAQSYMPFEYAGAFASLATGYETKVKVIGGLVLRLPIDRASAEVLMLPPIGKSAGVVHLSLTWRL